MDAKKNDGLNQVSFKDYLANLTYGEKLIRPNLFSIRILFIRDFFQIKKAIE